MDEITLKKISTAHPKIRKELLKLYKEINSKLPKDCRLRFTYVYRTAEEQHALFMQRPKVTQADAWQSIHNYGLAFDIVLLYDKDGNGTFETPSWTQDKNWATVVDFFKTNSYVWGGDWTFRDCPHFEKTFGYDWRDLKKFPSFIDNGLKYPIL